jgi:hypothetical protein
VLALDGGSRGLIQNSVSVCRGIPPAKVLLDGQNGKRVRSKVGLGSACGGSARQGHAGRAAR